MYINNITTLVTLLSMAMVATLPAAPQKALFISHRGDSMNAPENTMVAFRAAIEKGADGFELDTYLTKDNQLICLHDSTTKRTTGVELKPGEATLAELRALDAGSWKGPQFKGEKLPTLEEALELAHDNFLIYVEIKSRELAVVSRIVEAFKAVPKATPERALFICFHKDIVAEVRKLLPNYRVYWLTGTKFDKEGNPTPTAAQAIAIAKECDATGVSSFAHPEIITAEYIKAIRDAGLEFHVWTVDSAPFAAELIARGAQTITSNSGAQLKKTLAGKLDSRPFVQLELDGNLNNSGTSGAQTAVRVNGNATYVAGKKGQGVVLDGATAIAVSCQLPEQGSVAFWFKPDSFYNYNTLFDNDLNPNLWELWLDQSGKLHFRAIAGKIVASDALTTGGVGKWYHIVVAWDYISAKSKWLYVNGVLQEQGDLKSWSAPGGTFYLGGGNADNTKGKGVVDDVRLYSVALSAEQVKNLQQ